jgi:hypothetical protein
LREKNASFKLKKYDELVVLNAYFQDSANCQTMAGVHILFDIKKKGPSNFKGLFESILGRTV